MGGPVIGSRLPTGIHEQLLVGFFPLHRMSHLVSAYRFLGFGVDLGVFRGQRGGHTCVGFGVRAIHQHLG